MKKLIVIIFFLLSINVLASNQQFNLIQYHKDSKNDMDFFTNDLLYKSCSKLVDADFDYDLLSNLDRRMADFCQGMVLGIADLALLDGKFCPGMDLTTRQVLSFYTYYIKQHPVALNSPAAKTILTSMMDAWPCANSVNH